MCSIFGSYDVDKINELRQLNSYRGSLSHSISFFDADGSLISQTKSRGPMDLITDKPVGAYILCHQQAPTTQESNSIHPAIWDDSMLWHNGIIKQQYLNKMIEQSGLDSTWDTFQLNYLLKDGYQGLHDVLGSFSCVRYRKGNLFMFRNAISPMFFNGADISSTRFDGSKETAANKVYCLNPGYKEWQVAGEFTNVETPFFYLD